MPASPSISPGSPGASRHVARIDRAALAHNMLELDPGSIIDLSGDSYGHGARVVVGVARDVGSLRFGVRSAHERDALASSGIQSTILSDSELASPHTERLYGIGAKPVMRVSAAVVSVKTIPAGDGVSYGYTWRAPRPTALALVPLGYADGVLRSAGNRGRLLLGGRLRPIVGRIAMDVCVVEIGPASAIDEVSVGDEAVLFGDDAVPGVRVEDWAASLGVPPLSVTAGIGRRVPRVSL